MTYKVKNWNHLWQAAYHFPLSSRPAKGEIRNTIYVIKTYLKDPVKTVKEQAVEQNFINTRFMHWQLVQLTLGDEQQSSVNKEPANEQAACVMTFGQSAGVIQTIAFPVKRGIVYTEFFGDFANIWRYSEYHLPGFLRYLCIRHWECIVLITKFLAN